ncbi:MAG TPA: proton-conducting membrane transporter [Thermotoga sp.]|uniref:respiratory chain complex I subunit 1 family protein n=1 Tax=Thermotoga sp. (strain RQ2) TaxID=126740 RepID=UPI0001600BEA|nr:respiratory chain complex I subunit 1 family protein [Thermotoga sp. RQ2]ACB09941.1 respiratory-chain NADH dehydrogenase subunit 1 [Thermotoga sp. RQ2]HBF69305.1 proton-conducting membrane transporter [Thermotoga sp.]
MIKALFNLVLAFFLVLSLEGIARKIVARVQRRIGPPWYQNFIDVFKALSKHPFSNGWIFDFGVLMALGGSIATAMLMPLGSLKWTPFPNTDNFFVITYLFTVGALGMAMGMVGSGNPWASIGISRALTQMLGYELPFLVVMASVIFNYKTASIHQLITLQGEKWNLFSMPLGAIVAFISLIGMMGKKPFDIAIAPAEIASGPMVELSGKYLGLLQIMHDFSLFVEISLFVNVFLGGGSLGWFLVKFVTVWVVAVLISSVLPRFRIEQMLKFYWGVPLGLAFLNALFVVLGLTL